MATRLEIVTPKGRALSEDVDVVVVPGSEGELGVLAAHAPLVSALRPGELRFEKDGKQHYFAVGEGFLEVTPNSVIVLSDLAMGEEEIDEAAVENALAEARKALEERGEYQDPDRVAALQLSIQKSLAQLHVKRRRRQI